MADFDNHLTIVHLLRSKNHLWTYHEIPAFAIVYASVTNVCVLIQKSIK